MSMLKINSSKISKNIDDKRGLLRYLIFICIIGVIIGVLYIFPWRNGGKDGVVKTEQRQENELKNMVPVEPINKVNLGISACTDVSIIDTHFLKAVSKEPIGPRHKALLLSIECWELDWNIPSPWQRYRGILEITNKSSNDGYHSDGISLRVIDFNDQFYKSYVNDKEDIIFEKEIWEGIPDYFKKNNLGIADIDTISLRNKLREDKVSCFLDDCSKFIRREVYKFDPSTETLLLIQTFNTSGAYTWSN